MRSKPKLPQLFSILTVLSLILNAVQIPTVSAQGRDPIKREQNSETGKVNFIGPESGLKLSFSQAMGLQSGTAAKPADPAMALAKRFAPEFGLTFVDRSLVAKETKHLVDGRIVVHYQQSYQGVPVMGGELIVNTNENGDLYSISGEVSSAPSLSVEPEIDAAQARESALQAMAKWHEKNPDDFTATEPELWIFDESLLQPSSRPPQLVWRMDVTPTDDSLPIRELMLIDAQTGNIAFHFNQVDTSWSIESSAESVQAPELTQPVSTNVESLPSETTFNQSTLAPADLKQAMGSVDVTGNSINDEATAFLGATFYVNAATGNDSNDCSLATPCASIQKAVNDASAGDVILVATGTYYRPAIATSPNVVVVDNGLTISGGWNNSFTEQTGASIVDGEYLVVGTDKNNNGFLIQASPVTIDRFIIQNSTSGDGGGMYIDDSEVTVTNTTFQDNQTNGRGAAIFMSDLTAVPKSLTLINVTISGNMAVQGAVYYPALPAGSQLIITNSTIAHNTGGGLYRFGNSGTVSIRNTILAKNIGGNDCSATLNTSTNSIIGNTLGCTILSGSANKLNIEAQISTNLYGTPPVHMISFAGPAADAGTAAVCPATDAQGNDRPVDGNGDSVAVCDIGAFEFFPIPNVPAMVTVDDGDDQEVPIGENYGDPLAALVVDNVGNPVSGANVTFTAPGSGPSITFTSNSNITETVTTNASGIAFSSVFTANGQTGTFSVVASVPGVENTASFNLKNLFTPGIPTDVVVVSGTPQSKPVNEIFNTSLVAKVLDGNGDPVGGLNVTFTAPGSGASGTFYSTGTTSEVVVTNTAGLATSSRFTANGNVGTYAVNATIAELPGDPAVFPLENLDQPGVAKSMSFVQGNSQAAIVNRAFYTPLAVKVLDPYGNPASGVNVTFTSNPNGAFSGSFPGPSMVANVLTNASGIATAPVLTAGPTENGTFTVTVSSPGITSLVASMSTRRFPVNTYSAQSLDTLPGTLLCNENTNPCTSSPVNLDANSAHEYALGTLNLYLSKHGRNSVDNAGTLLKSSVQYCDTTLPILECPYYNAFWNNQMVYGNGYNFAGADDVVAHELTHGVTQHQSNLFYYFQSGAINESLSDLWGEYFDQINGQGNDAANVKWLIGEETGVPGGAFRNMTNPPQFGDPDKMTSALFYKGTVDNGGVHTNSGVNNKAVALMVDGGTFNGKTVIALGWDKVAAIYYEAQTNLLGNASNYSDLYYAVQQACININLPEGDCFEVTKALDAVQMNSPITGATVNQVTAPLCPAGMTTSPTAAYFNENFNGTLFDLNGWFKDSVIYTSPSFAVRTAGGNGAFHTLTMTNSVLIKPNSYLHFNHLHDFENNGTTYYDGGVVEYFKGEFDGGGNPIWRDASALLQAGELYTGTLASNFGNQLQGRRAFVGSTDAVSTRLSLSTLANQTIKFRFVYGTDSVGNFWGWNIDDVMIYQCSGTPSIPALQTPANNSVVTDYTPLLNWSDSAPALDHYRVQVDDNSDFSSMLVNEEVATSQYVIPNDLDHNKTYYWRVQAYNIDDGRLGWSPVWSFRSSLTPPLLVLPGAGDYVYSLRPVFAWDDAGETGQAGYTIQISTSSTFASIAHTASPVATTYIPPVDLPKGVLYWRVQSRGTNGPSAWSEVRSYQGPYPPAAPVLSLPANGSLTTNYSPTLKWNAVTIPAGAPAFTHYQVQLDDNSDFSSTILDTTILDRLTVQLVVGTPLVENKTYYWRVRAADQLPENGAWSAVWSFRTSVLIPLLNTPANGAILSSLRPTFDWNDVPGATGYTIQFSTNSGFVPIGHTGSPVGSTYTPTVDLPKGLLYWRVQTRAVNGPSAWSEVRSYQGPYPPAAPVLSLPANGSLTTLYTPLLKWNAVTLPNGAPTFDHYQVQLDDNSDFSSPLINDSSITNRLTVQLVVGTPLVENKTYYWRVRAADTLPEDGAWSAVWTFRTAVLPPTLSAPIDGFVSTEPRPFFDWSDVPGATGYTIQFSTNSGFTTISHTGSPVGSSYIPTADLPLNTTVYWRVQTRAVNGPSAWSLHRSLTTPLTPPAAPGLLTPTNNALTTDYTPAFSWTTVAGTGILYTLQVDNNNDFGSLEVNQVDQAATNFTPVSDLAPNTVFYWRVRARNGSALGNWSATFTLKTALLPPTLSAPIDGFVSTELRPTFDWTDVAGATGYTIQFSTSSTFATVAHTGSPTASIYTPTVDLPLNTTVYWRVQTRGTNGPSAWSLHRSLTTPLTPPPAPGLMTPANGSLTTDYTPTFSWTTVAGTGILYTLQVDNNNDFSSPEVQQIDQAATNHTPVLDLTSNSVFYWRVRARNGSVLGNWSTVSTLKTALLPPTLSTPANGSTQLTLRPSFDWDDVLQTGVTGYTIQFSTSNTFATIAHTGSPTLSNYVPTVDLPRAVTIYWRVQTRGTNGPSAWSSEWRSFQSPNPPAAPTLTQPANNALTTDYTPTFSWTTVTGTGVLYTLQVDNNNDFSSLEVNQVDQAATNFTPPTDLAPNSIFYWRVRAKNAANELSNWSTVFTLKTALLPPALNTPANGAIVTSLRPTFDWGDVPGATGYTIQFSTNSSFAPITHIGNPTASTYIPTVDLKGLIYWRVQTRGTNGPSAWSETPPTLPRSYQGPYPPAAPVLSLPANGSLTTLYTPTLKWNAVTIPAGAPTFDHYQVQLDDNSDFSSTLINDTSITNRLTVELLVGTPLVENKTYYWRVRAADTLPEDGAWSAVWTFRTAVLPPTLSSPINGFVSTEPRPMFDWSDVPGATGYTIQVSTNSGFTTIAHTGSPTASLYTPTVDLPLNTTVYWRVQTRAVNGPSAWSLHRSLTTPTTPPAAPGLLTPTNNALTTDYTPTFSWTTVAGTGILYTLQVDNNNDFSSLEVNQVDQAATSHTPLSDLASNTVFYWRVRARNGSALSNWSTVFTLKTALLPPTLSLPIDGFVSTELRPTFDWTDVSGATGYTIQFSTSSSFVSIAHTGSPTASTYIPTADLPRGLVYWRVQTRGTNGPSAWSLHRSLTTPLTPPPAPTLSLPANNSLTTLYTPTLKWNAVTIPAGAPTFERYHVQLDDNSDFSSPLINDTSITDRLTVQLLVGTPLASNSVFYWRVRAENVANELSNWSTVFTLKTALLPPVLNTPANGATLFSLRPTFDWGDVPGATGYTIQFSTSSTFATIAHIGSPTASTYVPTVDLKGLIYWRVQTRGTNGPSDWSQRSYTGPYPPAAPVLSLPANGSLTTLYTPTLKWNAVTIPAGAPAFAYYQVQLDDNSDFSSPIINDTSITDRLTVQLVTPALVENKTYYWRVRAADALPEDGAWSAVWTFRTAVLPPTLSSPSNGFVSMEPRPIFDWSDVPGATGYTIQFSTNSGFTTIAHTGSPTASLYTPTVDLPLNTTVYWRVQTRAVNGPSAWSLHRSLTTPTTPPAAPTLSLPIANTFTYDYTPAFSWTIVTGTGITYIIQVDDNSDFSSPVLDQNVATNTFTPASNLPSNTLLYWRVRAKNSINVLSNWSAILSFRTAITRPTLVSPAHGSVSVSRTPLLNWTDVAGNNGYVLQLWKAGATPTLVTSIVIPVDISQYQFTTLLLPNTAYFWKVQTSSLNGPSLWTPSSSFTTGP